MFRGPRIITWSSHVRPLLLQRESHLSAFSEHPLFVCYTNVNKRRYGRGSRIEGSALSADTVSPLNGLLLSSDSKCCHLSQNLPSKTILSSHHPLPQISVVAKAKGASNLWNVAEDFVLRCDNDFLVGTTSLQSERRPCDVCQPSPSFTHKIQCYPFQSCLFYRQPLRLLTHTPWILNHCSLLPSSIVSHQTRAFHQIAPREATAWRDCLSPENEKRCRQSLGPNLKLYEMDRWRKGVSLGLGNGQTRWASVLVSLCSVEDEPAFLFTLRSSTLKGRHKGDVSFAGGKSDLSDRDVVATALREAREELGVSVAAERVWGVLKPLRDNTGMMIAPVLANLGPIEELSFKPNPGEVEEIFTLSLTHLCNPQNRGYTHFRTGNKYGYTLPVFCNGKYRVWGLTAVALDHTLKLIAPFS